MSPSGGKGSKEELGAGRQAGTGTVSTNKVQLVHHVFDEEPIFARQIDELEAAFTEILVVVGLFPDGLGFHRDIGTVVNHDRKDDTKTVDLSNHDLVLVSDRGAQELGESLVVPGRVLDGSRVAE